jgi:hypothetical protein
MFSGVESKKSCLRPLLRLRLTLQFLFVNQVLKHLLKVVEMRPFLGKITILACDW